MFTALFVTCMSVLTVATAQRHPSRIPAQSLSSAMPYRRGSWNSFVIAPWRVQPVQALSVICAHSRMCAAFPAAEDTVKGAVQAGRYRNYYNKDTDENVCFSESSFEG